MRRKNAKKPRPNAEKLQIGRGFAMHENRHIRFFLCICLKWVCPYFSCFSGKIQIQFIRRSKQNGKENHKRSHEAFQRISAKGGKKQKHRGKVYAGHTGLHRMAGRRRGHEGHGGGLQAAACGGGLRRAERQFHTGKPQQPVFLPRLDGVQGESAEAPAAGLLPRRKGTDQRRV